MRETRLRSSGEALLKANINLVASRHALQGVLRGAVK